MKNKKINLLNNLNFMIKMEMDIQMKQSLDMF